LAGNAGFFSKPRCTLRFKLAIPVALVCSLSLKCGSPGIMTRES